MPVKRSVIDLVPTLLDLMRIPQPAPGELSGRASMMDDITRRSRRAPTKSATCTSTCPTGRTRTCGEDSSTGATPGMKLIHFGGRQYQLYDLATDPGETRDLAGDPAKLAPMVDVLQAKRATLKEINVRPDTPMLP